VNYPNCLKRYFFLLFFLLSTIITAQHCEFTQQIQIDTSINFLKNTPDYTTDAALAAHVEIEHSNTDTFNLDKYYYLVFRYRDPSLLSLWQKIIVNNIDNTLLQLWFINAVAQSGVHENIRYILPFRNSSNAIIREYVANSYGYLATKDSISSLKHWLENEKNGYVKKTIAASVDILQKGGYKSSIPYLPVYYDSLPRKLLFIYNKYVDNDPKYTYSTYDTSKMSIKTLSYCFPHQQYKWKIKNAPKAGTFGRRTGDVCHVGIDSGWLLEGLPVHSMCDGIVKLISHNFSWGTLVVIESVADTTIDKSQPDTVCAIYGHLSPYLNVVLGDTIHTGDKIGQIGSSVSVENGGYWAHLHFGITYGSFMSASIVGYDRNTLFFADPLKFIQEKSGT
jgi:murein DD-endopeptidase MepM/ murein hydrolase activator NlpD